MPIFDYHCRKCDLGSERIVSHAVSREQHCDDCTTLLTRAEMHVVNGHIAVETGARLWDGTRVKGRFGKANKRKRRQYP